jgi:alkanesulfonate monooxygenase SsuD/methylene tetrahydromethanopterin reductase-like flavin-dependent oxidoreductase (luciferase family)
MDFGIAFPSFIRSWQDVALAEQYGFTHAWFYDSQMLYSDVFATMALAAHHTKSIKLGTLVCVLGSRIPPVTANAIATINELAPGRVILGVGPGFTARNTMGLPPLSLKQVREEVRVIQHLLRGEETSYVEGPHTRAIRFLHPDRGYINVKDAVPVYLAAQAPKATRLAGEIAEGWITVTPDPAIIEDGRKLLQAGANAAGRPLWELPVVDLTACCVLREGESKTSERVKQRVGPFVAVLLHTLWNPEGLAVGPFAPPAVADLARAYHEHHIMAMRTPYEKRYLEMHYGHVIFLQPGEHRYITDELVDYGSLTGTRAQIIDRLRALERAGVTHLALHVTGTSGRDVIEEFGREIISNF